MYINKYKYYIKFDIYYYLVLTLIIKNIKINDLERGF